MIGDDDDDERWLSGHWLADHDQWSHNDDDDNDGGECECDWVVTNLDSRHGGDEDGDLSLTTMIMIE